MHLGCPGRADMKASIPDGPKVFARAVEKLVTTEYQGDQDV